ncbi:globin [Rarobacter incanus]|uniref:Hemoglobin n=1 Tax=Rarobacter incanus TaxID=153494 RepID=A0A542SRY7_9MICO|nr:globin [Rarobacter incanus]TQK77389.1 hemoglobin [Rarobacter incanus]
MSNTAAPTDPPTFFEKVGGAPFFEELVRKFYEGVSADPVLRPMYPEADLEPAARRLTMFLTQYWGGPGTYSQERGHPRLRMRHSPYRIDEDARDRWLTHMRAAVDAADLSVADRTVLWDYMERAAHSLLNSFDDSVRRIPGGVTDVRAW